MNLSARKLKAAAFLTVFILIGGGRLLSRGEIILSDLVFTLLFSCTGLLCVNLVLAAGDLKRTLGSITLLICIMTGFIAAPEILPDLILPSVGILILLIIFIRQMTSRREVPFTADGRVPRSFKGRKPFKSIIETLFRLFPHPVQTGLYPLNSPGSSAPLIITGNFSLTVRRVFAMMADRECRILVCDSRGINIWCSTLAGHFNTDKILEGIRKTGLKGKFSPSYGVLPLLAAAAVSPQRISRELEIPVFFGPLGKAPEGPRTTLEAGERTVSFPLKRRLEMALGAPFLAVLFNGIIYNALDPRKLLFLIPFIYVASLIQSLFIVKKHLFLKAVLSGGFQSALLRVLKDNLPLTVFDICLSGLTLFYLVFEFEGWSPIVKFRIGRPKDMRIILNPALCTGCGRCVSVCPKNVLLLRDNSAVIENRQECILCRSCLYQCPENALKLNSS